MLYKKSLNYKIVYYDTSAIKFYSDECEVYRPSEARVKIAFVMIKHLCTSAAVSMRFYNTTRLERAFELECVSTSAINARLSHEVL